VAAEFSCGGAVPPTPVCSSCAPASRHGFRRDGTDRQSRDYYRPIAVGPDFQTATKLPDSFLHPPDSNSKIAVRGHGLLLFEWYTFASVLHFYANLVIKLHDANFRHLASRMAMNICEALLHHPKNRRFHVLREPTEVIRKLEINLDFAAFCESFKV